MPKSKRKTNSIRLPPKQRLSAAPPSLGRLAWPRDALLCAGLALVIATAYWPLAGNDFINYDDDDYVVQNELVNQGLSVHSVRWAMTSMERANWHPLTWISHMLDCQLFGLSPMGHHLMSLGLHTANSMLLYLVLIRMTRVVWPSLAVAAFFAVHPLHVESVAWVAERKDMLSTLFGLLATWAWLGYLARPSLLRYAAVMLWFAASLMSKAMWVTFPFLLLLLDYWPLRRSLLPGGTIVHRSFEELGSSRGSEHNSPSRQEGPTRASVLTVGNVVEKLPLVVLSVASCVVTMIVQSLGNAVVPLQSHSIGARAGEISARFAAVAQDYCAYLWKLALPMNLAPIYPRPKTVDYIPAALCGIGLVLITGLLMLAAGKRRYLATGWFWYLGTLVPVIGLVQVGCQSIADRYTYLPSVGIFILVAWLTADLVARWPLLKGALAIGAAVALAACCVLTSAQVRLWASTETLFTHTAAVTKDNSVALTNLGLVAIQKEEFSDAKQLLRKALEIDGTNIDALGNMASLCIKEKRYADARAIFNRMIASKPKLSDDRECHAFSEMARTYELEGYHAEAESCLRRAVELEPESLSLHFRLAEEEQALGKTAAALDDYSEVLRLNPSEHRALNNVAWIYAAHPNPQFRNGPKAVELLRPLGSKPDCDSNFLDTLAAAYAEAKQFDDAVKTVDEAIDRARGEKKSAESIRDMEQRAALYKKKHPYRDMTLLGPGNASPSAASGPMERERNRNP
jgi:protein O-mannosyl-transferase